MSLQDLIVSSSPAPLWTKLQLSDVDVDPRSSFYRVFTNLGGNFGFQITFKKFMGLFHLDFKTASGVAPAPADIGAGVVEESLNPANGVTEFEFLRVANDVLCTFIIANIPANGATGYYCGNIPLVVPGAESPRFFNVCINPAAAVGAPIIRLNTSVATDAADRVYSFSSYIPSR